MENQTSAIDYKTHILVLPYYAQGHINPILQAAKRFASKSIKITVASLASVGNAVPGSLSFESIYDDYKDGGYTGPGGYKSLIERFDATAPVNLIQVIKKLEQTEHPIKCLLYDHSLPWAIDIAKQHGLASATFFTMSCTMIASLYPLYHELVNEPLPISAFPLPELPEIRSPYFPSMGSSSTTGGRFPPFIRSLVEQIKDIDKADWVLFNTYYELEQEVVEWMSNLGNVRTIGPTVPSFYLDERIENDIAHEFNMYNQNDEDYMKWLGRKDTGSVIYVSFGSCSNLSSEQMAEIAEALRRSTKNFLWVVRETEQDMLPKNFAIETLDKGLVIPWCSQLEVLDHDSVGCFLTHCGWNSTLEAMSLGVPMVAIPQFLDQTTNAYCVERMWGVGMVSEADNDQGFVVAGEILRCIREVMDGGNDIKENAVKWKKLANEAVNVSGSSDKNIDEIINCLVADL